MPKKKLCRKPRLLVEKSCPICETKFTTYVGKKEKQTCSYGCSNTFFRSGKKHPNFLPDDSLKEGASKYRRICFRRHKKECVVCKENKIVAVHHYDENHENNDPPNLIPLCPTHHQYMHSRHAYLIRPIVVEYIAEFMLRQAENLDVEFAVEDDVEV
jgi:hypothetical protein